MDIVDKATRSRMMSGIGPRDTAPELAVRRYLHAAGMRFRLHDPRLPGRPDIVVPGHKAAVFVHGCFWHRHPGCPFATTPATNAAFWKAKFARNVERDREVRKQLRAEGWTSLVIWECEATADERLDALFWHLRAL